MRDIWIENILEIDKKRLFEMSFKLFSTNCVDVNTVFVEFSIKKYSAKWG